MKSQQISTIQNKGYTMNITSMIFMIA